VRTSDSLELGMRTELFDDRTNIGPNRGVTDPDAFSDLAVAEPRGEQAQHLLLPARQLSKQESALLARPLLPSPPTSEGDDVGDGLQELHMVVGEAPPRARVCPEHAEGRSVAGDQDAQPTENAVFSQELRRSKARFRRKIADHDRLIGLDRMAGVGFAARAQRRTADQTWWPSPASTQQKRRAARKKLEDRAQFDPERLGHTSRRVFEQDILVRAGERLVSEGGDRRLLASPSAQLLGHGRRLAGRTSRPMH